MTRPYRTGDIISCLSALIVSIFELFATFNNYRVIHEGKYAAKFAFDVINRIPVI